MIRALLSHLLHTYTTTSTYGYVLICRKGVDEPYPQQLELVRGDGLTGGRVSSSRTGHHSIFCAPAIVADRVIRRVVADLHLSVEIGGPVNETNVSVGAGDVAQDSRVLVMTTIGISAERTVIDGRLRTSARTV